MLVKRDSTSKPALNNPESCSVISSAKGGGGGGREGGGNGGIINQALVNFTKTIYMPILEPLGFSFLYSVSEIT